MTRSCQWSHTPTLFQRRSPGLKSSTPCRNCQGIFRLRIIPTKEFNACRNRPTKNRVLNIGWWVNVTCQAFTNRIESHPTSNEHPENTTQNDLNHMLLFWCQLSCVVCSSCTCPGTRAHPNPAECHRERRLSLSPQKTKRGIEEFYLDESRRPSSQTKKKTANKTHVWRRKRRRKHPLTPKQQQITTTTKHI